MKKQQNSRNLSTKRRVNWIYHVSILGLATVILIAGGSWRGGHNDQSATASSEMTAIEKLRQEVSGVQSALRRNELQAIRDTMAEITRPVAPAVVALQPADGAGAPTRRILLYREFDTAADRLLPPPVLSPSMSGLLIDREGYLLTSASALEYRGPFHVHFDTSRSLADVIAVDSDRHIALLRLRDTSPVSSTPALGDAPDLKAGEWLIRQGRSPTGEETRSLLLLEALHTTASGETIGLVNNEGAPQTDGAVLIDVEGRIVGIYVRTSDSTPYVIPIRRALQSAAGLKERARVQRLGWVGLELQDLTADLKEYFSIESGVLVASVGSRSPAEEAGLQSIDLILTLNGENAGSARQIMDRMAQLPPGTKLIVGLRRNGRDRVATITVAAPPASPDLEDSADAGALRLEVSAASGGMQGVVISMILPRAMANTLGLQEGDVIQSVNGSLVRNEISFWASQRNPPAGKPQLWGIRRSEQSFFVAVRAQVSRI